MKISDQILKKIKMHGLTPKPKWYFEMMNIGWWSIFVVLMIIGSIAFGVAIYMFTGFDWQIARRSFDGIWEQLLLALPMFWIALIFITTIVASWELRQTEKGYRYGVLPVLAVLIIGSALLGSIVYASGFGERLDTLFTDNIPVYHGRLYQQMRLWDQADNGLLIGRIYDYENDEIILHAPHGLTWRVDISNIDDRSILAVDEIVKVTGVQINENEFKADTIELLEMGGFMGNQGPPMRSFMHSMDNDNYPRERLNR